MMSPVRAGFSLALCTLSGAAAGLLFGRLRRRLSDRAIVVTGLTLVAVGLAALVHDAWTATLAAMVLSGWGVGMVLPGVNSIVASAASGACRGRAAGFSATALFLAQFLAPVGALLFDGHPSGVFGGAATLAGACAVAIVVARRPRPADRGPA